MSLPAPRTSPLLTQSLLALMALTGFALYMDRLHPEVVFMDSLRFLAYFDDSERGLASLLSTWNQNEHRGLAAQLAVYLNARYFGLAVYGATLLSGIALAATAILLGREQHRSLAMPAGDRSRGIAYVGLAALTFFAIFSLANWELYSLDFGVTLFGKNLAFVIYWIGLDRTLCAKKVPAWSTVLLVSTPAIVLLLAYGWSYAFVLASIGSLLIADVASPGARRFRVWAIAILAASLGGYVASGYLMPSSLAAYAPDGKVSSLANIVASAQYALLSAFVGVETLLRIHPEATAIGAMAALLSTCVALLVATVFFFPRRRPPLVPTAMMAYGLLHVAAVSVARGRFDPLSAMAPRYYLDISLLVVGALWSAALFFNDDGNARWRRRVCGGFAVMVTMAFLLGQGLTIADEWKKAPYRNASFQRMKAVTLSGVQTPEDASLLQQPFDTARRGVEVQRRYGIGPYREFHCDEALHQSGWFDGGNDSGWVGARATALVRNCGKELWLTAYIPESFPPRKVTVTVNGKSGSFVVEPGQSRAFRLAHDSDAPFLQLDLHLDATTRPADLVGGSTDQRDLGLIVSSLRTGNAR